MAPSRLRATSFLYLLTILILAISSNCQSTTIVTATTTVTATASDPGACNNFVGACVVYGSPDVAPYTTTVWASSSSPAATTVSVPASATDTDACNGFTGACVVYATNSGGVAQSSTTLYPSGSSGSGNNGDGEIGTQTSGDGYIGKGAASRLEVRSTISMMGFMIVALGLAALL